MTRSIKSAGLERGLPAKSGPHLRGAANCKTGDAVMEPVNSRPANLLASPVACRRRAVAARRQMDGFDRRGLAANGRHQRPENGQLGPEKRVEGVRRCVWQSCSTAASSRTCCWAANRADLVEAQLMLILIVDQLKWFLHAAPNAGPDEPRQRGFDASRRPFAIASLASFPPKAEPFPKLGSLAGVASCHCRPKACPGTGPSATAGDRRRHNKGRPTMPREM